MCSLSTSSSTFLVLIFFVLSLLYKQCTMKGTKLDIHVIKFINTINNVCSTALISMIPGHLKNWLFVKVSRINFVN
jgi:hypothetical protein